jgi:beta-glucosidase-like glycosyl hydrolase
VRRSGRPLAIVRNEWAYGGVLMSDFFATHSTAETLNAGLDLEMPGPARFLGAKAETAVAQGETTAERVQDAAARVVRFNQRFGGAKTPPRSMPRNCSPQARPPALSCCATMACCRWRPPCARWR